jgi:hypothetical protein
MIVLPNNDAQKLRGILVIGIALASLLILLIWARDTTSKYAVELFGHYDKKILALLIMIIFLALLLLPILQHVSYGWRLQIAEIEGSLSSDAKRMYLELFHARKSVRDPDHEFHEFYVNWYGRKRLLWPILILVLVAVPVLLHLADWLVDFRAGELSRQKIELSITPAAIAGAYTFAVADIISRVQRRSFRLVDIVRAALRLTCAVPIGIFFSAVSNSQIAPFVAFALGAFPLETVVSITRRFANKQLGLEIGPSDAPEQVRALSGVDQSVADRIADSDITTISQLAWCDPIQLCMRTNLRFAFVIDIVSQSLAWVYLEGKLDLIRPFGLRGAYEINVLLTDDLRSRKVEVKEAAESVLLEAAKATQMSAATFRYTLEQIAQDEATKFLVEVG